MTPPLEATEWFGIWREPLTDILVLLLENGDSYQCGRQELETWLHLMKEPQDVHVLDVVWNFYAIVVTLPDWRIEQSSLEEMRKRTGEVRRVIWK